MRASPQVARWRRDVFEEEGDLEDAGTLLNKEAMYDLMIKEIREMEEEERVSVSSIQDPRKHNISSPGTHERKQAGASRQEKSAESVECAKL